MEGEIHRRQAGGSCRAQAEDPDLCVGLALPARHRPEGHTHGPGIGME